MGSIIPSLEVLTAGSLKGKAQHSLGCQTLCN